MNEIILKHKLKGEIKRELNTSYPTIRLALLGETNTDKAKTIREKALQLGGVEVEKK